jgi:NADH-quinone oxidoreductase subunit N
MLADSAQTISTPSIAYHALLPIFIVLGAALLGVLVEAVVPRPQRFNTQVFVTLAGLIAALVTVAVLHGTHVATPSPVGTDSPFAG